MLMGWLALISGPIALFAMHNIYRIKARPYWNHWQVLTTFYGNALSLGSLMVAVVYLSVASYYNSSFAGLTQLLAWPLFIGLAMEIIGLIAHRRYLHEFGGEAHAAHVRQTTDFGYTYLARNAGLMISFLLVSSLLVDNGIPTAEYPIWILLAAIMIPTAVLGRALFYVIVIPTTMPGAFFWKNQGFQEHARESGLANMPQVGVVPDAH